MTPLASLTTAFSRCVFSQIAHLLLLDSVEIGARKVRVEALFPLLPGQALLLLYADLILAHHPLLLLLLGDVLFVRKIFRNREVLPHKGQGEPNLQLNAGLRDP